ncbi:MAG: AMP-binding protein [Thermoplasmatales archaeon]|nr:MAG: AMP-binding protein [Thermoplasmatales archaeon]
MGEFNYEKEYKSWKWNIPEKYNIGYDCVDKHTETNKRNKVALYWENSEGDSEKFTFNDMKRLTNKFGNALKKLGFNKGDRFLIRLPNIPEFHVSFLGGIKIGAIPIPSSVILRSYEIEYRINDSGIKAVITSSDYVKDVNEVMEKCQSLEQIIIVDEAYGDQLLYNTLMNESSSNLDIEPTSKEDMAFICYKSESKEKPNGVVHLQRWVPGNDPSILFWQQGRDDDLLAHTGDLNWIYPLGNGFLYPWRWGFSTFIYNGRFNSERWFELLENYKITNLASVPMAYHKFIEVKDAEKKYDLSSLRHCISAGEPLNTNIINKWKKLFNLNIYEGIGMTEIMVFLSNFEGMKIKPGSCGKPHPGKICSIVNKQGKPVPDGENGVLGVRQDDPGLFKEYWKNPKKTEICFKNGWFLTGNILYKDKDGYYWFSRKDKISIHNATSHKNSHEIEFIEDLRKFQSNSKKGSN